MGISGIIRQLDRDGWRWLASTAVFIAYRLKGEKIQSVRFNPVSRLWEYRIDGSFFITKEASWFSSQKYYLDTLQRYSCFQYLPTLNDTVIDVGAGVGEEVIPLAACVGTGGKVYALEANPRTYDILNDVVKQNNFGNTNLFLLAISESKGAVFIEDDGGYGVSNSIQTKTTNNTFEIPSVSIDDFIEEQAIDRVDLLKVNIEGAERFLVRGMKQSIRKIRNIAISCHDFRYHGGESEFFKTKEEVISFLEPNFRLTFQQSGDPVRDSYVYGVNKLLSN
jgi:FkbM family methyltransferase